MDGIINVLKPPGMSSHQVVAFLRRTLGIKRVGHTGTLDPGAVGVLPICVGKGTRIASFFLEEDKTYVAELTLGIATDTQDASGNTTDFNLDFAISPGRFADILSGFLGEIEQVPPMASAVRVQGKRLYELARQGKAIDRPARKVKIHEIHVNKIWPETEDELRFGSRVLLEINCSKGTYIRTLCHDIGTRLGVGAHMSFLARTVSGPFKQEEAFTLEEIETMVANEDYSFITSIQDVLSDWQKIIVSGEGERRILNGNYIDFDLPDNLVVGSQVLIVNEADHLLAIGEIQNRGKLVCQPIKVFG
ncbi:MAG: tRNA pseudouridine(55) synthase TruB [Firmicutes bacterium]|nr:tRNA pseudouridine(55) synthase TruB [Bacillota bacterium]